MSASLLAKLVEPVGVGEFLDRYFGQRPLLVRGTPGKFDILLKPADFVFGLERVAEIRCVFGELRQATIAPGDIREMFESGATICVSGIDRAHRSLQRAARRIEREIGYAGRVDFRAYLSPPGSGFDIHYDARVATTLQLEGTKTWWYSDTPALAFPTENSARNDLPAVRRRLAGVRLRKVVLRPGDLLCLPPGFWHRAKAGAGGSLALNLAFNHSGATVLDVVLDRLRQNLMGEQGCREPFYVGAAGAPSTALPGHLDNCLDAVERTLQAIRRESASRLLARARPGTPSTS